ncbi:MAG: hypothetical protein OEY49_16825, partial [Candidatus Heimdallarchaeota archaeon]|nr:hypothetical protein [Candidatus Heimdallarchaeota archaeon]
DDTTRNNDEIQYHTNPVSGKVAVTFDKEMILAIQHTLTPMLLNILQFDWENMKQLSEGEIGNFIQYTLNDHDVLQYFTNLVFDKLYEKATEKEGSNSKLDLHKPLHKVKEIIRVYVPIWEGTYTYKNKEYPFLINGESGMIEGEYKMSLLQNLLPLIICLIFLTGFGSLLYIIY